MCLIHVFCHGSALQNLAANGPDAWRDQMVLDKYVGTTKTTVWPRYVAPLITIFDPAHCSSARVKAGLPADSQAKRVLHGMMSVCRHEDKYYGSVADKVQDWLMLTPDPTVDVSRHKMKTPSLFASNAQILPQALARPLLQHMPPIHPLAMLN